MAMAGGSVAFSSYPCAYFRHKARSTTSTLSLIVDVVGHRRNVICLAVQESSTPTDNNMLKRHTLIIDSGPVAAETKEKQVVKKATESTTEAPAAKPKAAAKTAVKPLPQMMEEDIIPSLKSTLEAQQDLSELTLSFDDNKLEGSFMKNDVPYTFWAFFPDGLNGPKGFSLSSYGSGVSTVEPFLVDEKKPTAKLVVFWVEKRLAAQGIIPVWQE